MIIKYLDYISKLTKHVDAIMILNRNGIVEYSGMYNHSKNRFMDEGVVGKHIFEVYPALDKERSSHSRVMATGIPILNEKQTLTNYHGDTETLINSTFPILDQEKVIGTIEISVFDESNVQEKESTSSLFDLDDIITNSPTVITLKNRILRLSNSDASVMLYGETGTGKELFAQSIHSHSKRSKYEFISINCAAIPSTLIESTLFGTVKGSFTGAENQKGLFEIAHKGTLFLDEINSMDINLQSKILKAIEDKAFRAVGSNKIITSDVRIVSAMNISPNKAIESGLIRSDLFYRLAVVQMELPPLRTRENDVLLLTDYFLSHYSKSLGLATYTISELVLNILQNYTWPGNIRELKNTIEAAVSLSNSTQITVQDLPEHLLYSYDSPMQVLDSNTPSTQSLDEQVKAFERRLINEALLQSSTKAQAAKKLGISRQSLRYKVEKHNL